MKRAVILAKRRVPLVGYRDDMEEIARRLEITGFVENVKPYDVRIVALQKAKILPWSGSLKK